MSIPWGDALQEASRLQATRVAELEAENVRLHVTVVNLKRRLQQAKLVHANWLLRAQSWRVERDELLTRLAVQRKARPRN